MCSFRTVNRTLGLPWTIHNGTSTAASLTLGAYFNLNRGQFKSLLLNKDNVVVSKTIGAVRDNMRKSSLSLGGRNNIFIQHLIG